LSLKYSEGERMPKKSRFTTNSQIKSALRRLFLRSRERAEAMKTAKYTCSCGAKQSRAKGKEVYVECHHKEGVLNWDELYKAIRKYLLCHPDELEILCKDCHGELHGLDKLK
jgi:hypothetical protein